jgi:N utilization substance protein B
MTRKEAREQAFALVFESAFHQEGLDYIIENAAEASDEPLEIGAFARELASKTLENRDLLDEKIAACSSHWKTSRMSRVALAILRNAVCEMYFFDDIPDSVSINEAVELAKTYGGEDDPSFVNGVLGAVYKRKQEANDAAVSGD